MSTLEVTNPRTGKIDYRINVSERAEVATAAQALREAQSGWADAGSEARCAAMQRWQKAIARHAGELGDALCIDTGRHLLAQLEVASVQEWMNYWISHAPGLLRQEPGASVMAPSVKFQHQLKPYPVVGVISPWNVPLILGLIDAVPALLAGSAILLKPSEVTPRFAQPLQRTLDEVPELAAVFRIVLGGAETGQALVDNVDAICFTGSITNGRKVAAQAAANFIPAFLELGGKDAAIVLPSADLENASNAIIRSAAGMNGQACQSLERIYVHEDVYEPLLNMLIRKANAARINWPDIHKGQIGPFILPAQAQLVKQQLDEAVAAGAVIHCGGVEDHGGMWCRPVVISGVDHTMSIMREETFGPVMPVMSFSDIDDAIELANDSRYGLSGAVFAADREEGEAVARRMVGGAISINDASLTAMVHDVEKNSFCLSGMGGSRMGDTGLMRFFRKQAILYQSAPAASLEVMEEAQAAPAGTFQ